MCMSRVITTKMFRGKVSKSKHGSMTGYKWMYRQNNTSVKLPYYNRQLEFGKWYDANNCVIDDSDLPSPYTSGFHIYLKKEDARDRGGYYDIYEVQFDEVVAIGEDQGLCVVAKRMKVVKKV